MSTSLSLANLPQIAKLVPTPRYERDDLKPGIVHFGVGNFHRAHQAVYLNSLFNLGKDLDWAIIGAGLLPSDATMRSTLKKQDYLSTVVEQSAAQSSALVTGVMIDYLDPTDVAKIIDTLLDPRIRIASLTITEGGYYINAATGKFDPEHPEIAHDGKDPEQPKTVFGVIAIAIKKRRKNGVQPFTVMSCDNVPHNGVVARNAVVGTARLSDPELADWIANSVAFPNAMVDRITPATSTREKKILTKDFGITDGFPVFCEDFTQWVLEDNFPGGRPAFEEVGVEMVADVTPYETMKIRILNGGHAIIAYPAGLLDIHFAHEAMENKLILDFLQKVEFEEIIPIVPPVPATSLTAYFQKVQERFANPKIGDTIRRLCLDGSNRQPKFIIPSIADRLKANLPVVGLALESALWARYCFGITESGEKIEANDPNWERLAPVARAAKENPAAWLAMEDIYGELGRSETFAMEFSRFLKELWQNGVKKTITNYLQQK